MKNIRINNRKIGTLLISTLFTFFFFAISCMLIDILEYLFLTSASLAGDKFGKSMAEFVTIRSFIVFFYGAVIVVPSFCAALVVYHFFIGYSLVNITFYYQIFLSVCLSILFQTVMCKHIGEIIIYNNVFLIHASAVLAYFSLSFFLFAIIVPSSNLRKIIRGKSK